MIILQRIYDAEVCRKTTLALVVLIGLLQTGAMADLRVS